MMTIIVEQNGLDFFFRRKVNRGRIGYFIDEGK